MNQSQEENYPSSQPGFLRKPRILVAPLDWGLGHATRCIPLVLELIRQGCEVLLAGEGLQEKLLKEEFPDLPFLSLEGYRVTYSRKGQAMLWTMFRQTPKIMRAIRKEHVWLEKTVMEQRLDAVISDNRFGLYHAEIPCIFMTHQLVIKSPLGNWLERLLQKRNYTYINHFAECWVPDMAGTENLAGELSHPDKRPDIPIRYLGVLSRFTSTNFPEKKGHLLIILSGPEPQRTILEYKIGTEVSHYEGTCTVVRGVPGFPYFIPSSNMIKFHNHLPQDAMKKELEEAEFVISRSGYSTIMDLVSMGKKAILLPTPGQPEQEYLCHLLSEKKIVCAVPAQGFSLEQALKKAKQFEYRLFPKESNTSLENVISQFIHTHLKK